jgi:hypothetical protein
MRQDLVAAALEDIRQELFADVDFTPAGGSTRRILAAISGVEIGSDEGADFGVVRARQTTYQTHAPKILFPDITAGSKLVELDGDGNVVGSYSVLDFKPFGDGRLEIQISLTPL